MAENPENPLDNLLHACQETIQHCEQIESLFRQLQYLLNVLKEQLLSVSQNLMCILTANIPEGESEFEFDHYHELFLAGQHLYHLITQMCATARSSGSTAATTTPINNPQTQARHANENEQQLRKAIDGTRVVPRVKGLQDIGGLVDVKHALVATVVLPIHQPQLYVGRKICNSILLYGPPGTGKTQLAHALAAEASATLFSVTATDILSHYVGQTEKLIRTLFETVREERSSPTILFMDEIDGLCRSRSDSEPEWNRRVKTELMCQLSAFEDHPKVFLICATNCPWDLDPAFLRRFQQRIYVPLPNRPDRFDLLQLFTKGTPLEITSAYWGDLLNRTEGYSGSDLADLVRHTLDIPIRELISNTRWEQVGADIYKPASIDVRLDRLIYCELRQLPPGSVQARQVDATDLMTAVGVIKRTTRDATLQKYAEYIK